MASAGARPARELPLTIHPPVNEATVDLGCKSRSRFSCYFAKNCVEQQIVIGGDNREMIRWTCNLVLYISPQSLPGCVGGTGNVRISLHPPRFLLSFGST